MGDVKLFKVNNGSVSELQGGPVKLEKKLQSLIEKHLESFLSIRFVVSEHITGKNHGGRIDTLGLDENYCPTIIEYKRHSNANVINQGLFYLDWLMDHQGEFELLVLKKFGKEIADKIDWYAPRLLCIAEDFTKYDVHAVQQMNHNIELLRYAYFENDDLLMLDLVNAVIAKLECSANENKSSANETAKNYVTQTEYLEKASPQLKELFEIAREYMLGLDDDVQERMLKWYIAYKRLKNFASVKLMTQNNSLLFYLPLKPDEITLEEGFARDVRNIGHHGTGDLELTIRNADEFTKAKPYIQKSFEES